MNTRTTQYNVHGSNISRLHDENSQLIDDLRDADNTVDHLNEQIASLRDEVDRIKIEKTYMEDEIARLIKKIYGLLPS